MTENRGTDQQIKLLAIFAHPDDESFGVSGTIARYATAGVRTALVCATRGEAGQSDGLADSAPALAALRTNELVCAAQAMGVDELEILNWPDGGASGWDMELLAQQLVNLIRRVHPTVVVTFDAEGVTRHPDHIAVHRATRMVLEGQPDHLGVRRLFYGVVTCEEDASPEGPSIACVPPTAVDVTVDIGAFEEIKRAALRCHRTQAADTRLMLDRPMGSLVAEHYQLAWDVDGWQPGPGAGDLLANL